MSGGEKGRLYECGGCSAVFIEPIEDGDEREDHECPEFCPTCYLECFPVDNLFANEEVFDLASDLVKEGNMRSLKENFNSQRRLLMRIGLKTEWQNSAMKVPQYETDGSAGFDLQFNGTEGQEITLNTMERTIVPTGLFFQIEEGYEVQIRPRSGLAAKMGLTVLNAPGTIDSDYRDEIGVILVNLQDAAVTIKAGERIAQAVVAPVERAAFKAWDENDQTDRGGGFGSTGQ